MNSFSERILEKIQSRELIFPGLDDKAILNQILPIAEEWTLLRIISHHLSVDDQVLFRDSYMSAPDIFDPVEFLSDILPELDNLIDRYFDIWLIEFDKKL